MMLFTKLSSAPRVLLGLLVWMPRDGNVCDGIKNASDDLGHSLASVVHWISTTFVDLLALQPLLNYRFIVLNKNSGVCFIGVW